MTPKLPKQLPIHAVHAGAQLLRIHHCEREALWFGPERAGYPINRFDDPQGEFRVCYLGATADACFAETFLRNPPVTILALEDLRERDLARVVVTRALRLVAMHGTGLAKVGATAEVTSGTLYKGPQAWSRALWMHSDEVDGIAYRARHDDSVLCAALYDRAREAVVHAGSAGLTADPIWLAAVLKRYGVGVTQR